MFLEPLGKSKKDIEREVNSGRFPPCILYQIIYSSPEGKRVKPALMDVQVHGANVPLIFGCRIKEEPCECVLYVSDCMFMCLLHACFIGAWMLADACQ